MATMDQRKANIVQEVLPKAGLVYSEKGNLSEVLCKPKIMPIKSQALERLEEMEKQVTQAAQARISTANRVNTAGSRLGTSGGNF
mmetsp:Transcript_9683/g.16797  ORF Transcript_9683/g.16797 Transcript_9683/m.16797 type:complete len:85 (+) Transcript_9683:63-317(+)